MKRIYLAMLAGLLLVGPVFAANTITEAPGMIVMVTDGATDLVWTTATFATTGELISSKYPDGLALTAIKFKGSAANDRLIVRNMTITGTVITDMITADVETKIDPINTGKFYKPAIDISECVHGTDANCLYIFEFSNQPK